MSVVINYFTEFKLKTKKNKAFNKWCEVYNLMLKKEHLTQEGLDKIKILAQQINENN